MTRRHSRPLCHVQLRIAMRPLTGGVRADRVEVAQQDGAPLWLGCGHVTEHVFDDELGAAVGADSLQRVHLINGHLLWVAVHCA